MRIEFTKMHGLGNDFMLFDLPAGAPLPSAAQWRALSDRHTGIGFDQAVVLQPPRRADSDVYYRVFNADGSEAEQSGNGARCLAALLYRRGHRTDAPLAMDSLGGLLQARMLADARIAVDMGAPDFAPRALPFDAPSQQPRYALDIGGEHLQFSAVSMGNPHVVLCVPSVDSAPVERIGRALQADQHFPRQVNVGFMQVVDREHVRLRVYERGAGETRACGTGACAAMAVGRSLNLLGVDVEVHVPGGILGVHWDGPGHSVWLTGPVALSFEGRVEL
jgi:diaminopimelate epimerase